MGSLNGNLPCWPLVRNAHKAAVNQAPGNWSSRLIPAVGHVIANGRFGERRPYCAAQHSVIDTPVSAPPRFDGNTRKNEASVTSPTPFGDCTAEQCHPLSDTVITWCGIKQCNPGCRSRSWSLLDRSATKKPIGLTCLGIFQACSRRRWSVFFAGGHGPRPCGASIWIPSSARARLARMPLQIDWDLLAYNEASHSPADLQGRQGYGRTSTTRSAPYWSSRSLLAAAKASPLASSVNTFPGQSASV